MKQYPKHLGVNKISLAWFFLKYLSFNKKTYDFKWLILYTKSSQIYKEWRRMFDTAYNVIHIQPSARVHLNEQNV